MVYHNDINELSLTKKTGNKELSDFKFFSHQLLSALRGYGNIINLKPQIIYLVPTKSCNLNCVYCYAHPIKPDLSSFENFNFSLADELLKKYPSIKGIDLVGGEVALSPKWVSEVVSRYNGYTIHIQTNATLLHKLPLETIMKIDAFGIGFEPRELGMRKSWDGKAQYDLAINNIRMLLKLNKEVNLTIPYSVNKNFKIIEFVDNLKKDLQSAAFTIRWTAINAENIKFDAQNVFDELVNLIKTDIEKYRANYCKYMFNRHIQFIEGISRTQTLEHYFSCGSTLGNISVGYDGNIYTCNQHAVNMNDEHKISDGNDYNKAKHKSLLLKYISKTSQAECKKCSECRLKFICFESCRLFYANDIDECCEIQNQLLAIQMLQYHCDNSFFERWDKKITKYNQKQMSQLKVNPNYRDDEISNLIIKGQVPIEEFEKLNLERFGGE